MAFNIAIDGPAGAGKSTIAKKLAADLGYVYVDTAAMYRAMAYYFLQNHIDASDEQAIAAACPKVDVTIQYMGGEQQVILNKENVNGVIRKEEVGNMASATSVYPVVRTKLVELQRQLAAKENVIMDGRDIGTVVLPNANVKIYLTASSKVRAKRRFDELTAKGVSCDMDAIEKDIIEACQKMNLSYSTSGRITSNAAGDDYYVEIAYEDGTKQKNVGTHSEVSPYPPMYMYHLHSVHKVHAHAVTHYESLIMLHLLTPVLILRLPHSVQNGQVRVSVYASCLKLQVLLNRQPLL